MTPSRTALAAVFVLFGMSAATADTPPRRDPSSHDFRRDAKLDRPRWISAWFMEALRNAIADATDPRDRHSE